MFATKLVAMKNEIPLTQTHVGTLGVGTVFIILARTCRSTFTLVDVCKHDNIFLGQFYDKRYILNSYFISTQLTMSKLNLPPPHHP
jgi:hypothetical protein